MNIVRAGVLFTGLVLVATACGANTGAQVPSLAGGSQAASTSGGSQAQALHAAAQCIRDHGIPHYQDPVVDPNGNVYTDQRSLQDAAGSGRESDKSGPVSQAMQTCRDLISRANFNPQNEPKATPELVAAGVKAAQCLRAHGLPNYRDPTASTEYTPGHGFGITADELPAGGKTNGIVQQAFQACRTLLDQEINASGLSSLSHG